MNILYVYVLLLSVNKNVKVSGGTLLLVFSFFVPVSQRHLVFVWTLRSSQQETKDKLYKDSVGPIANG